MSTRAPAGDFIRWRLSPKRYMEAPAICKRQGTYYFIGSDCTGWGTNRRAFRCRAIDLGAVDRAGEPMCRTRSRDHLGGQSTFILPVAGRDDAYIAMFDLWRPENAIDGRYMWLPMMFRDGRFELQFLPAWDLSIFD